MDPLSVLTLVEACAGLAVTAGKLAIGLKSLADNYKSAALTFRSLSTQCRLFATAVRAIQAWMEEVSDTSAVDDAIWEQLADSLECANDSIYALENELVSTSKGTINTFWDKVNVLWDMKGLKELHDCIHKQITGLGVILQIMNLPTRQCQTDGLAEQSSVFQESRSSAMTVRDPEASTIRGRADATSTMRPASTIMTSLSQMPHFDFEEMLLTSQVYLRNRNRTLALYSTSSKPGIMQDAGTSVTEYDLPLKFKFNSSTIELIEAADIVKAGSKEDLIAFLDSNVLVKHAELQNKYSKVKRYYFDQESQIEALQAELARLKDGELREKVMLSETSNVAQLKTDYEMLDRYAEDSRRKVQNAVQGTDAAEAYEFYTQAMLDLIRKQMDHHQRLLERMGWYHRELYYHRPPSNSNGTVYSAFPG